MAVDEAELALELQCADGNADKFSASQFGFDADLGDQRDAVAHGDELFDGLQRGEFEVHVERGFVRLEKLDHFLAVGGGDDVRDKRFGAELADADAWGRGEGMFGRGDEYELVEIDDQRVQAGVARLVRLYSGIGSVWGAGVCAVA